MENQVGTNMEEIGQNEFYHYEKIWDYKERDNEKYYFRYTPKTDYTHVYTTKNRPKEREFREILIDMVGNYTESDFTVIKDGNDFDDSQDSNEDSKLTEYCICGTEIVKNCVITHKELGVNIIVGSECVKRFFPSLRYKKCKYQPCTNTLKNKRKKIQKEGYCSEDCKYNYNKKVCSVCKKNFYPDQPWKHKCLSCYLKTKKRW
jgi:hypothetical protein